MALIKCPECGKEVSDQAVNCPQCGYILPVGGPPSIRSTELSEPVKHYGDGFGFIFGGVFCLIIGLLTAGIIIGFLFLFFGIGLIYTGVCRIRGEQSGLCPYCKHDLTIGINDTTVKCPHCHKVSTRSDNNLKAIE